MKKFFTLSLISLFLSATALADEPSLTVIEGGEAYGGYMPECISGNGTYVGGSTFMQAMFMSEWQQQDSFAVTEGSEYANYGAEIRSVTNDGIGAGFDDTGALTFNFATKEITYLTKVNKNLFSDAAADGISADGSVVVGYVIPKGEDPTAAYWENGELQLLTIPTYEEVGFDILGSRALLISDDAQTIVGYLVDKRATNPMIIWHRQADGTYECDAVCARYFCVPNEGIDNEFIRFTPMSLSHNGKLVLMNVTYNDIKRYGDWFLAYYDIEKDELTVSTFNEEYGISPESYLFSMLHGISDKGTSVGYFETENGRTSFIMYADEMQPRLLVDEYPLADFSIFEENGENAVSGISADGRYICGMGSDYSEIYKGYYFVGYVLDRGESEDSSVKAIGEENVLTGETEFYTIDGIRVSAPVKGLNIIRCADGKVKKVIY